VAQRRSRSFREFSWFFWEADQAWVFDNSGAEPRLVAGKLSENEAWHSSALEPELLKGITQPNV